KGVAAFPTWRLRQLEKQEAGEAEVKMRSRQVEVELKLPGRQWSKPGNSWKPHCTCRNGRTPFASSNLARSATISGRRAASPSVSCFSEHDSGGRKRTDSLRVAAFPENPFCRIGNAEQQTSGEVHMTMARIYTRSSS